MKKLCLFFVSILLVAAVSLTAFAAESVTMTIKVAESTVLRGDTVSLTVEMSEMENCRSAGVMLVFDEAVFEFVGGRCTLSGTALASASDGTGVFSYGSAVPVSGEIFTFQLKVKSDAAYGDHSITANVSARNAEGAVPATVNSVRVTVAGDDSSEQPGTTPATVPTEPETTPATRPTEPKETTPATRPAEPKETTPVTLPAVPEETTAATVSTAPTETQPIVTTQSAERTEDLPSVPTEATEPAAGEAPQQSSFPWWILLVGGAAVIGGTVIVATRKKT